MHSIYSGKLSENYVKQKILQRSQIDCIVGFLEMAFRIYNVALSPDFPVP